MQLNLFNISLICFLNKDKQRRSWKILPTHLHTQIHIHTSSTKASAISTLSPQNKNCSSSTPPPLAPRPPPLCKFSKHHYTHLFSGPTLTLTTLNLKSSYCLLILYPYRFSYKKSGRILVESDIIYMIHLEQFNVVE